MAGSIESGNDRELRDLKILESETKRFLCTLKAARARYKRDQYACYGAKETAACKRASLDLTRALAAWRRRR